MTRDAGRRYLAVRAEVGRALDRWDPIGVYCDDEWPAGEYDGLAEAIVGWIAAGLTQDRLGAAIELRMATHFGLSDIDVPTAVVEELERAAGVR